MQTIKAAKKIVHNLTVFETAVEKLDAVESMPNSVTRLLEITEDPDYSMTELIGVLSSQHGMVVKILRVASSPLYGSRPAESLRTALIRIGSRDLRKVIMTCGLINSKLSPFCRKLWSYSLKVAAICEIVAQYVRTRDLDDAFLCGLLHDYGSVLMRQVLGKEYSALLKEPGLESQSLLERETYGFDHCDLGVMIAQKWCLFETLEHVMQHHHDPLLVDELELRSGSRKAVFIVALARQYVLGCPESSQSLIAQLCERLELSIEEFEDCGERGLRRFDESYAGLME